MLMKISNDKKTNEKTKRELKILYETEKKYREEIEKTLNERAIESQQQVEMTGILIFVCYVCEIVYVLFRLSI